MENKTAVEWLIEQYNEMVNGQCYWEGSWHSLAETKTKALEMEKQQIIDAIVDNQFHSDQYAEQIANEYYSETFKK